MTWICWNRIGSELMATSSMTTGSADLRSRAISASARTQSEVAALFDQRMMATGASRRTRLISSSKRAPPSSAASHHTSYPASVSRSASSDATDRSVRL